MPLKILNLCILLVIIQLNVCLAATVPRALVENEFLQRQKRQDEDTGSKWNYDNFEDWGDVSSTCATGKRQTPIALRAKDSVVASIASLKFHNYFIPIKAPLQIANNGKSVSLDLPEDLRRPPAISGGKLPGRYIAINIHFHWGTKTTPGSEHVIDGYRYDLEMHIVHRNSKYSTTEEALERKDGLAVLGIMLEVADAQSKPYNGINKIFDKVPQVTEYDSEATISGPFVLGDLLGNISLNKFYTYKGSLTTPPCSEVVTWFVFPEPITVPAEKLRCFYELLDNRGKPLLKNWRPLQEHNNRLIKIRAKVPQLE